MEGKLHQLEDVIAREGRGSARLAVVPDAAPGRSQAEQPIATLAVTRPAMERFYGGGLKLMVARGDAARWRTIALPPAIAAFVVDREGDQAIVARLGDEPGAAAVATKLPPGECLAAIAFSDDTARDLEAFCAWWARQVPDTVPELLRVAAARADKLEQRVNASLLERVVARQRHSDARVHELQSALAELREAHEETHTVLAGLGDVMAGQDVPPLRSALALHPATVTVAPPREAGEFAVRQRLPIHSQGLAALALHVAMPRTRGDGKLLVRLLAVESQTTLISWAIPYDQLHSGWNLLEIPSVIAGPRRSVDLMVRWAGDSRGAPHLSLSEQPIGRPACAQLEGGRTLDRAIALQLWTGLPGARRTASAFAQVGGEGGLSSGRHLHVSAARLAEARLVAPANVKLGFDILTMHDQRRVLQLHPVKGHCSVAAIAAAVPPGVQLITGAVKTDSPQGPPVEYALAWAPAGKPVVLKPEGVPHGQGVRFSGWSLVPPNQFGSIVLAAEEATDEPGDLYLFTRVPSGVADAYAWARWFDLRLDLK
jgi:hypothetical protein